MRRPKISSSTRVGWIRLALGAATLGVALTVTGCGGSSSSGFDGAELATTIPVPDVTLTDTSGQPFNLAAQAKDKLTLVYFGYTNCPDVCPTTMADLGTALGKLEEGERSRVQVVFITTDPHDDTPAVLRKWLDSFNASFIGLTGDLKTVQATAAKLGVAAEDPTTDSEGHVTDTHGAQVIAFSPSDGRAHLVWLAGTTPTQYAHDIALLLA